MSPSTTSAARATSPSEIPSRARTASSRRTAATGSGEPPGSPCAATRSRASDDASSLRTALGPDLEGGRPELRHVLGGDLGDPGPPWPPRQPGGEPVDGVLVA